MADRARTMGGGVGSDPPGDARRLGRMEASKDWDVWCILEVVDIVEIVETLERVGDLRSCPCGRLNVGRGDDDAESSCALGGRGEMGGKRKSEVARTRDRVVLETDGTGAPPVLLWALFRLAVGRSVVERSGEEVDRPMGGWLSRVASMGDTSGISILGTPR